MVDQTDSSANFLKYSQTDQINNFDPITQFSTYIISMDSEREKQTRRELSKHGIENPRLIPGVDGKVNRLNTKLTSFCKKFCTDRIVGCALAHSNVAKDVVRNNIKCALVVEDDIVVTCKDLKDSISNIVDDAHGEWDIITLYCMGICDVNSRLGNGSTAAYLLSYNGAKKMSTSKIGYHADFIRNSLQYDVIVGPDLFDTLDPKNFFIIGKQDVTFWLNQDCIKLGVELKMKHFILANIALSAVLFTSRKVMNKSLMQNIIILLIILPVTLAHYMTHETQYYRCSNLTHIFAMIFPALIIVCQGQINSAFMKCILLLLAYTMISFHLLYEFDK